jgi:hypothetical protein
MLPRGHAGAPQSLPSAPASRLPAVEFSRESLTSRLADHYRAQGWPVEIGEDGIVAASGPGGVTWIGAAVLPNDVESGELEARLPELAERRMPHGGELCPLELLPAPECDAALRGLLDRLGLGGRRHVAVYSAPA